MDPLILHANTYQFASGEEIRSGPVASRMQLWCLDGRGSVQVDGCEIVLDPERVLLLPWGFRIRYRAERRRPFRLAGIHLVPQADPAVEPVPFSAVPHDGTGITGYAPVDQPACSGLHQLSWQGCAAWRALSEYVLACFTRSAPEVAEQRRLARQLVAEWRWVLARPTAPGDRVCAAIVDFVQAHPRRSVGLQGLTAIAGCSTATLSRRVRAAYGCSPTIWVQRLKVELAKARLADPRRQVAEVAAELGFSDAFYFSRIFSRHAGMPPSAWRARHRLL